MPAGTLLLVGKLRPKRAGIIAIGKCRFASLLMSSLHLLLLRSAARGRIGAGKSPSGATLAQENQVALILHHAGQSFPIAGSL